MSQISPRLFYELPLQQISDEKIAIHMGTHPLALAISEFVMLGDDVPQTGILERQASVFNRSCPSLLQKLWQHQIGLEEALTLLKQDPAYSHECSDPLTALKSAVLSVKNEQERLTRGYYGSDLYRLLSYQFLLDVKRQNAAAFTLEATDGPHGFVALNKVEKSICTTTQDQGDLVHRMVEKLLSCIKAELNTSDAITQKLLINLSFFMNQSVFLPVILMMHRFNQTADQEPVYLLKQAGRRLAPMVSPSPEFHLSFDGDFVNLVCTLKFENPSAYSFLEDHKLKTKLDPKIPMVFGFKIKFDLARLKAWDYRDVSHLPAIEVTHPYIISLPILSK